MTHDRAMTCFLGFTSQTWLLVSGRSIDEDILRASIGREYGLFSSFAESSIQLGTCRIVLRKNEIIFYHFNTFPTEAIDPFVLQRQKDCSRCHGDPMYNNYVIMSAMASQITSLTIVYSTVYSGADRRKHRSSASLAFVRGIHR